VSQGQKLEGVPPERAPEVELVAGDADSRNCWPSAKAKIDVGATHVFHPYGGFKKQDAEGNETYKWAAPGYKGIPPHWMIGRVVRVTRSHWILKTPAPYDYVWKLPCREWGISGRVVGYRSGDRFYHIEH
jgi:hypothetical protein